MDYQELYNNAHQAGLDAVQKLIDEKQIVAMVVGQETSPFSGKLDYSKPTEYVEDGVCGFAWISVKPGNSRFANWLKKNKIADKDRYYGGVSIWVSEFNQSMQKKAAYAGAFAKVLRDSGIRATSASRMD